MKLNYSTTLTHKTDAELMSLVQEHNEEAKEEILIRSRLTPAAAIALCEEALKKNPQQNFYHLMLANLVNDFSMKRMYLEKAARSNASTLPAITAHAALELAKVYREEKKYIEAHAWLTRAIILGSTDAQQEFLSNNLSVMSTELLFSRQHTGRPDTQSRYFRQWGDYALDESLFLAVILSHQAFTQFDTSSWRNLFPFSESDKEVFTKINVQKDTAIKDISIENTPINKVCRGAITNDPFIYLDFFDYCRDHDIISDRVYLLALDLFFENIPDPQHTPRLKDNATDLANYSLCKYYVCHNDLENAYTRLGKISPNFINYKVSDFVSLPAAAQDKICYEIFKKLTDSGQLKSALLFLNNVKDMQMMDKHILTYFAKADPDNKNYELYQLKKQLLKNIIVREGASFDPGFFQDVIAESEKLNNPLVELRCQFLRVLQRIEEYMEVREERKRAHPLGFWFGERQRQDFLSEAKKLGKSPNLLAGKLTKSTATHLFKQLYDFIQKWQKLLNGPHIKIVFLESLKDLEEIQQQIVFMPELAPPAPLPQPAPPAQAKAPPLIDTLEQLSQMFRLSQPEVAQPCQLISAAPHALLFAPPPVSLYQQLTQLPSPPQENPELSLMNQLAALRPVPSAPPEEPRKLELA